MQLLQLYQSHPYQSKTLRFAATKRPLAPPLDLLKTPSHQQHLPHIQNAAELITSTWQQFPETLRDVLRQAPLVSIGLGEKLTDVVQMPEFRDIPVKSVQNSPAYKVFGPDHTNHRILISTHLNVHPDGRKDPTPKSSRFSNRMLRNYFLEECGHVLDNGILSPQNRLRIKGIVARPDPTVSSGLHLSPEIGADHFSCTDRGFIEAYQNDLNGINQHYLEKPAPQAKANRIAQYLETMGFMYVIPQQLLEQIRSHISGQRISGPLINDDPRSPFKECFAKLFTIIHRGQRTAGCILETGQDITEGSPRLRPSAYKHFARNQRSLINGTLFTSSHELRVIKRLFPRTLSYLRQHLREQGLAPMKKKPKS